MSAPPAAAPPCGRAVPVARLVLNGRFLAQVQTGVQRYALETLKAMDAILADEPDALCGVQVELALPDGAPPPLLRAVRAVHVPGRAGHLWEQFALLRHARGAYLLNFNYSGPLLKRRQMITVHDATVKVMPEAFTRSYRWVHNLLVAALGRTALDVATVSAFSRDELRRCFGLRRNGIVVAREGGEHAVRPTDDAAVLERHGLRSGRYLLGVGSIKPNKNFGLIGRAMRLLPALDMPVAVVGARDIGIFRGEVVDEAGFRFLGFVDDTELSALYRHAAWFVFPSLYEGFGLPAVEAMAHDCPVLAARAASIPEVCGDAALYFDPQNPADLARVLQDALADPARRARMVAAGRARLAHYSWPANARLLLDHLRRRLPIGDRPPAAAGRASIAVPLSGEVP